MAKKFISFFLAVFFIVLGLRPVSGAEAGWCYDFNKSFKAGSRGGRVAALHIALEKEGFTVPAAEKGMRYFGEATASAVVGFQEKYAGDVLKPSGLAHGTGLVWKKTRAKLNALYGCAGIVPYLKIISPKGGEIWESGKTYRITWESKNIDTVWIEIDNYFESKASQAKRIAANFNGVPAKQGYYEWKIDESWLPFGDNDRFLVIASEYKNGAKTKIRSGSSYFTIEKATNSGCGDGKVSDSEKCDPKESVSDCVARTGMKNDNCVYLINQCSDRCEAPCEACGYVNLLSPVGGENWNIGDAYSVSWDYRCLKGKAHVYLRCRQGAGGGVPGNDSEPICKSWFPDVSGRELTVRVDGRCDDGKQLPLPAECRIDIYATDAPGGGSDFEAADKSGFINIIARGSN